MKTRASRPPVPAHKPADGTTQQDNHATTQTADTLAQRPAAARARDSVSEVATGSSAEGRRLPDPLQRKMQAAFGHDFSNVRVYESQAAPRLGAVALAQGADVHLAPGAVDLNTSLGEAILGHELAHVVQQRSGRVGSSSPVQHSPLLEDEANVAGIQATLGQPVPAQRSGAGAQPTANPPIQMVNPEDVEKLAERLREENAALTEAEAKGRAGNALKFEESQATARKKDLAAPQRLKPSANTVASIEQRKREHVELQKWNPNAEGRNQGLVHVLDYAYARPPIHEEAEQLSSGQPMSGQKLMEKLAMDPRAFATFAKTNLEEHRSENEREGKPLLPVPGGKTAAGQPTFTKPQEAERNLAALEGQMGQMMQGDAAQKKLVGQSAAYRALAQQRTEAQTALLLSKGYRVKRDESKKGRIEQVERAMGERPGTFKSHGGELVGVTQALDALTGRTQPAEVKGPTGAPKILPKIWEPAKVQAPGKRVAWTETADATIADTSQSETYLTAGAPDRPALDIKKWGSRPDAVRYSTVFGAKK